MFVQAWYKKWADLSERHLVLTLRIQEWRTHWGKENLNKGWGFPCQAATHFKVLPKLIGQKLQWPPALSKEDILASKGHLKHSEKQVVNLKDVVWKTNSPCIRDNIYKALNFWPRHLRSYRSGGSDRVKQHHSGWLIISMNLHPLQSGCFSLKPL